MAAQITKRSRDVMDSIMALHVPTGSLVVDLTYGTGGFWSRQARQLYRVVGMDCDAALGNLDLVGSYYQIPLRYDSVDCVVFDPPFGCLSTVNRRDNIQQHYRLAPLRDPDGLLSHYREALINIDRILKSRGIAIVKAQDQVNGGKKHWIINEIIGYAKGTIGPLCLIDQAIQVNLHPPAQPKGRTQRHLRQNFTTYLVFRKR
jgi:hypothetical protein